MTDITVNNKSQFINSHFSSTIVLLIIAIVFALVLGSGAYGYGNDWYAAYHKHNLGWGGLWDRLGYILATLSIGGVHIGVHLVSFILSISAGLLIREHLKYKQSYSLMFFILVYIVAIHTWPIIMSTSNAMRQGLTMSFVFIGFVSMSRKKYFWMLLFFLIAMLTHKSGRLLVLIVIFAPIINNLLAGYSHPTQARLNFLIGIFLLISAYFVAGIIGLNEKGEPSKIIGLDFRVAFLFLASIYIALSFLFRSLIDNPFNLSLYYFSFIAPSLVMNGLNYEYERLGMMMLIPYILCFGTLLKKSSYQIYLFACFLLLFLLTIAAGMYASFK
tara:strand:+ start:1160 stop:2149 length:990 start_codon:yes stop_codon:yes gene_type:complete